MSQVYVAGVYGTQPLNKSPLLISLVDVRLKHRLRTAQDQLNVPTTRATEPGPTSVPPDRLHHDPVSAVGNIERLRKIPITAQLTQRNQRTGHIAPHPGASVLQLANQWCIILHMTSAAPGPIPQAARRPYLDGIRALAALYVLVHHAFMTVYPVREFGVIEGWVGKAFGWALWGHFGVTVFIVLAGYSLTLGLAKHDGNMPTGFWGFLRRRTMRIVPPYWAALALTVVLVVTYIGKPTGTHWDLSVGTGTREWLVNSMLLQDIIPVRNAAYTFWSVAVEYHIYLMLPLLLIIWRLTNWKISAIFGASIGIIGILIAEFVDSRFDRLFPEYYLLFSLSVTACIARHKIPDRMRRTPWTLVGAAFFIPFIILITTKDYTWTKENYNWIDLLVGISIICLILSLECNHTPNITRILTLRPLPFVATFSYSLYLIHAPLLQAFWQSLIQPLRLTQELQLAAIWLAVLPLICLISYAFYRVFEKPFTPSSYKKIDAPKVEKGTASDKDADRK